MEQIKQQKAFSQSFTRRDFLSTSLKAGAAAFTTSLLPTFNASADDRYNVLFIMVDDLRPLLGCYGHSEMHTPNIDRIAQNGTVFNSAYCQYPLCSPSRTSMLTGLRPDTTGVKENRTFFRQQTPDMITLPQHFKAYGYHAQSVGKVAHIPAFQDDEFSWSVPSWRPLWKSYDAAITPSWQALDVDDDELRDGKTARRAVNVLKEIKNNQFFLALGFYKPHLPYHAPKKYFELYDNATFNLPAISEEVTPELIPPRWNAVRAFEDIPSGTEPIPYNKILELTHAYAASISYIDAQIGRVLNKLDDLGLTEKTVIAFCGDHGYNLGENGTWGKNIIYEATLHSPLIVSVPGQQSAGHETQAMVELVDIFPTLCDACELPILPKLEGLSMMPIIEQPSLPWKNAVFSQFKQTRTIRTEQYRYAETGAIKELYDYGTNPNSEENIAEYPENAELVVHLSERLEAGWQAALPEVIPQASLPKTLPWDINDDGIVDMQDLILVSNSFWSETLEYPKADVNEDGSVDIIDLLLIVPHLGKSTNTASPKIPLSIQPKHLGKIEEWLIEARQADDGTPVFRKGIATLEAFLNNAIPKKTVLLPNYPNPFNPETWIPYDLAQDADVHIRIYNLKGESIRQLSLGFQTAGTYRTQAQAAYWDGQNSAGEPVASGIYFYTLHAGQMTATRQMVIVK